LLSLVSLAKSSGFPSQSSCQASDRILVSTRTISSGGHDIQISTKACSTEALAAHSQVQTKRQTFDACEGETISYECVTDEGEGPLEADCLALQNALPPALAAEGNPEFFTVPPQFVEEFSFGTCLWAWFNTNPTGGATLQYCYGGLEDNGEILDEDCVVPGFASGGIAIPSSSSIVPADLAWVQEVLLA